MHCKNYTSQSPRGGTELSSKRGQIGILKQRKRSNYEVSQSFRSVKQLMCRVMKKNCPKFPATKRNY